MSATCDLDSAVLTLATKFLLFCAAALVLVLVLSRSPRRAFWAALPGVETGVLDRELASDGLVVLLPNRGAQVAPFDVTDFPKYLDALDLMRGAWNLSMNRGLWRQWASNENKPVNRVLPGPVHTLHHPDGRDRFRALVAGDGGPRVSGLDRRRYAF